MGVPQVTMSVNTQTVIHNLDDLRYFRKPPHITYPDCVIHVLVIFTAFSAWGTLQVRHFSC